VTPHKLPRGNRLKQANHLRSEALEIVCLGRRFFYLEFASVPEPKQETIAIPKWFWGLVIAFAAWMTTQSFALHNVQSTNSTILIEHERRILRIEDWKDRVTESALGRVGQ